MKILLLALTLTLSTSCGLFQKKSCHGSSYHHKDKTHCTKKKCKHHKKSTGKHKCDHKKNCKEQCPVKKK